jgi:FlaA1/EpsC-like NDP-sugar epimerase
VFNVDWLLKLPRWQKRLISIFVDVIGLLLIAVLAIWLRLGNTVFPITEYVPAIVLLPLLALPVFIRMGLYRAVVRYISHRFVFVVFSAVSLSFLLWATAILMLDFTFPRSALIIAWLLALFYVAGSRFVVRWFLLKAMGINDNAQSIVIFGAGASGRQLMQALESEPNRRVVAFIDDEKSLKHQKIGSIKVYPRDELQSLISRFDVKAVLLAIPSLKALQKKKVLMWLEPFSVAISTLPSMEEIADGKVSFADIRDVSIEDLLGRGSVPPRDDLLSHCISNNVVMVTGGGGSIGSELCRQVLMQKPKTLIVYELSEFALYSIEQDLLKLMHSKALPCELVFMLGDVKNASKLSSVIQKYQVETIYHAAAYKHVPMVEHNIAEGILNNSIGTYLVAKTAAECGVQNFVLISTDKAVRPTNFMGASKRLAEMSLQALQDKFPKTRFVMVRFGNVLGSSGSVIPLFKEQIALGGPVTVTHKEITRYFMTIPEAACLVIQAGSMGVGGDVFVLDMGEPVKIADLAARVIHLSGLEVVDAAGNGDIEIQYTGLRPGEKLYEELLIGDNVDGTDHPRIMKAHEAYLPYDEFVNELDILQKNLSESDFKAVSNQLEKLVDGFNHNANIVDYLTNTSELSV